MFCEAVNDTPGVDEGREDGGEDIAVSDECTRRNVEEHRTALLIDTPYQILYRSSRRHTGIHPPLLLLDDLLGSTCPSLDDTSEAHRPNQPARPTNKPWHDVVLLEVEVRRCRWRHPSRSRRIDHRRSAATLADRYAEPWASPSGQSTDAPRPRSRPCWVFGGILPERLERAGVGAGSYAQSNAGVLIHTGFKMVPGWKAGWYWAATRRCLLSMRRCLLSTRCCLLSTRCCLPTGRRNILWHRAVSAHPFTILIAMTYLSVVAVCCR
ncbi:uncharacterized protein B0H18DRAFT_614810 [Fomitopsis serialis]|uniref:uncharacterized protein n=1 Tax=Fomitopsis serialis TaxID=139415 RepID=UPI0020085C30|nr:uncharacterized protein B0H18DRAFT_614810 [Neoantrodia serialis]KAH9920178.1 hypothetical protein B0H18DRAFT_614810 [Neoantrodia serialis]